MTGDEAFLARLRGRTIAPTSFLIRLRPRPIAFILDLATVDTAAEEVVEWRLGDVCNFAEDDVRDEDFAEVDFAEDFNELEGMSAMIKSRIRCSPLYAQARSRWFFFSIDV
jgi:hypothetical protein